ncbi:MAG TPA: hypothetical protein VFR62_07000 [Gemmatimonadales bacterium]|jgi:hypothetical protein|nr:hypothetical protein [Gemmatimonadales bacterium]
MSYAFPHLSGASAPAVRLRSLLVLLTLTFAPGCGSGGDAAAPERDGENAPDALPQALVGSWKWEEIGDVVCDPATGQCTSSYARSQTLELTDAGGFTHVLVYESHLGGCSLEVLHESEGGAEAEEATLLLHIAEGTTRVQNSCGESGVTDESGQTDRYTWEVSAGESGVQQLTLVDEEENTLGPFQRQ